jgi:hypothetical protein
MIVNRIPHLTIACLLLLAVSGCNKNNNLETPVGDAAAMGCANSLRQIVNAKDKWAQQSGANSNSVPTWDDLNRFFRGGPPTCPSQGTYTIGSVGDWPKCSIAGHNDYFSNSVVGKP